MHKGLNLPFVAGDTVYWQALKWQNPHDFVRIDNLYTSVDFSMYRADGFDHVRIPVDPNCVGVSALTGEVVLTETTTKWNPAFPNPPADVTAEQNIIAIRNMAIRAIAADLAVVIVFQPTVISEAHYDDLRTVTYGLGSGANVNLEWSGATRTLFVRKPSNGVLDGNHPLAKFWTTFFPTFLKPTLTSSVDEVPASKVFFEIMHEPFVDFRMDFYNPNGRTERNDWVDDFRQWLGEWRDVQKNAIVALMNQTGWPAYKFIATTAVGDSREYGTTNWNTRQDEWKKTTGNAAMPVFGNPYLPSEVGADRSRRIIYTAHMYAPLEYAKHRIFRPSSPDGEWYNKSPDYVGTQSPVDWDPMKPSFDRVLAWQNASESLLSTYDPVQSLWNWWRAPVLLTEAGVAKRPYPTQPCEPGVCGCDLPLAEYDYNDPSVLNVANRLFCDRMIWHWDMRTTAASQGMGVTLNHHAGQFGVYRCAQIHFRTTDAFRPIHTRPVAGRPAMDEHMRYALFDGTGVRRRISF